MEKLTANPNTDAEKLMEKLAREIVDRRLSAPAIFMLESLKPFNFITSQLLVFSAPIIQTIFNFREYHRVIQLLEERENIERLICEIEAIEDKKGKDKNLKDKDEGK